ncbi:MAG: NusG domain II-containing protein [Clostridiales bacterium]|nr:NusG domain II-containing protein [Clostridiales bacterium]
MEFAKKSDLLLIVAIIAICLLLWGIYATNNAYNQDEERTSLYAEIYYKNELVKRIPLKTDSDYTFSLEEKPNVVFQVYSSGGIAFIESDCPDKVCIKTGKLPHPTHKEAVCLPNSLVLKVISEGDSSSDDIDIHIK